MDPEDSRQFGVYEQLSPVTGFSVFCALLNLAAIGWPQVSPSPSRRGAAGFADGTEMAVGACLAADAARCSTAPANTGTVGAVLSSDDYGSSVERTATPHPLWRVHREWADTVVEASEHYMVRWLKTRSVTGLVSADVWAA
jgi:hypothetical protein